eukprot:8238376-Alexandrium_andersonii.AAC.1
MLTRCDQLRSERGDRTCSFHARRGWNRPERSARSGTSNELAAWAFNGFAAKTETRAWDIAIWKIAVGGRWRFAV